ncbi:fungal-specific transcription factor domain-containing protein [Tricladium varicosporioides]|nr:fungal-specific transcription factor domain-containing protein [Hymenoscyphus varicosporioides]
MEGIIAQDVSRSTRLIPKRRRPTLSCLECRRRKIKCDRNEPCNHCKRSPGTICLYKNLPPAIENFQSSYSDLNTTSTSSQTQRQGTLSGAATVSPNQKQDGISPLHVAPQTTPIAVDGMYPETKLNSATDSTVDDTSVKHQALSHLVQNPLVVKESPNIVAVIRDHENAGETVEIHCCTVSTTVIHDGNGEGKLRTKFSNRSDPIHNKGDMYRMQFFGQSHWKHSIQWLPRIWTDDNKTQALFPGMNEANQEIRNLLEKCKMIARQGKAEAKAGYPNISHLNVSFKEYFPVREVADELVRNYFRTMESTYRILHIPSFHREYQDYWSASQIAPTSSIIKILLVMTIGTCFYQEEDYNSIRIMAQQWLYLAQVWVSTPFEKGRLNLSRIQVECLLILARQTNAVSGDLTWVAAGSLLRTAFQMGFHRDPKYFPKMSIMHGELRRRLWATVLEIAIQTSLDFGMPPLITSNDFDTSPPSNINDEDMVECTSIAPTPKPADVFTQTSIQIQLLKSLHTRLGISLRLNSFHPELSYNEVLNLSSKIEAACKEATLLMSEYSPSAPCPTAMHRNLLDVFIRRFLLIMHRPFAVKSKTDPLYYFSRKVCMDTATTIISYPNSSSAEPLPHSGKMDDYTRLKFVGGGFYKEIILFAGVMICLELIVQLEEEYATGLPPSASAKIARVPLHQYVQDVAAIFVTRIALGDNDVKSYLFLRAAMGKIDGLENGMDPEKEIVHAVHSGVQHCWGLLKARIKLPETSLVEGEVQGGGGELAGEMEMSDQDFSYDFIAQDVNLDSNFDMPYSWLFSNGVSNNKW